MRKLKTFRAAHVCKHNYLLLSVRKLEFLTYNKKEENQNHLTKRLELSRTREQLIPRDSMMCRKQIDKTYLHIDTPMCAAYDRHQKGVS